jgi:hypothetical protein
MYNTSDKYYTAALPDLECENSGNYTIEVDTVNSRLKVDLQFTNEFMF